MTVFKRKLENTDKHIKFTGVHLPLELNSYLVLFATASETSKSKIIENSLQNWKEAMLKKMSINELIEVLIEKALITFKSTKNKNKSLAKFLNILENELTKKGVNSDTVHKIRKGVYNGAN